MFRKIADLTFAKPRGKFVLQSLLDFPNELAVLLPVICLTKGKSHEICLNSI